MAILKANVASVIASVAMATLAASTASAQTRWEYPGTYPYTGTPEQAALMHEKAIGLPAAEFMKGVALFNAGQCEERYLQDGETLQNTFTKKNVSRSTLTVVAFKYPKGHKKAGQSLPTDDPKRRAMRCRIPGRTDGATVVFPFVCGNWSVQYLPPPVTPIVTNNSTPPPPVIQRMRSSALQTPIQVIGGTLIKGGCCNCTIYTITPTITIGGQSSSTNSFEGN